MNTLAIDFPECIAVDFPAEFPVAWQATADVLQSVRHADLSPLARHSPALAQFDWANYLRLSTIRMARAQALLWKYAVRSGRLLDLGAYFGNFALMFQRNGYAVDAADGYSSYGAALDGPVALLSGEGVNIVDCVNAGSSLREADAAIYDIVACMGVLEHVPHTPRPLLEEINRVLRPGGLLLMDTPNLGYLYNRQKLAGGESVFCPIELQYHTEIPFEGHHREYTVSEVRWLIKQLGYEMLELSLFNYSLYGAPLLAGADVVNFRAMEENETMRELILSLARKPA